MSYLIKNNEVIAKTSETLKSGLEVRFSNTITKNTFNANIESDLVNAAYAKISNAKKWDKVYYESNKGICTLINADATSLYLEFHV